MHFNEIAKNSEREMAKQAAQNEICNQILRIMKTYHEQEESDFGVDTPGGLEHMGDVWSLFHEWERKLLPAQ